MASKVPQSTDRSLSQDLPNWRTPTLSSFQWSNQGSNIRKWPTAPQTIKKWNTERVLSVALDIVLLAMALCFAAFGISVRRWEGIPVDSATYRQLERAAQLAPTIFPMLFAAIVGRALKSIAIWRLEQGATLGYLDQLVGSTSISTAVTTQFKLRAVNVLSLSLIAVWALSPLGGQGSIRILETATKYTNTSTQIQFANMSTFPSLYQTADTAGIYAQCDSLFAASLSSPSKTNASPTDTWGNIKIPVLELLNSSVADANGWITPPSTGVEYASLIGLPLSTITADSNTYFNIETNYWSLECLPLSAVQNPVAACNITGWNMTAGSGIPGMYLSSYHNQSQLLDTSTSDCRQLAYCGWDTGNYQASATNCTMKTSYVEIEVHCAGLSCGVSRIRRSKLANPSTCWTSFDATGAGDGNFIWYSYPFVDSLGSFHAASVTPFQGFLVQPNDPFNVSQGSPSVGSLSPDTFALRLSQLMNTYWSSMVGTPAIQFGVADQNLNQLLNPYNEADDIVTTAPGTVETSQVVIACNHSWLIVLLLSVVVLVIVSVAGIAATSLSMSPDIAFNVSSMIKDSPHVTLPFGGSTLPAGERARKLKHVKVRVGDVDGDDLVGSIAIASQTAIPLRKNRLYA